MSSLWTDSAPELDARPLKRDAQFDVAVLGAGITGVTAAYLLAEEGPVGLLDAGQVGHGVSGHSTAKVTSQHRLALSEISPAHGAEAARVYAQANAGVAQIAGLARSSGSTATCAARPPMCGRPRATRRGGRGGGGRRRSRRRAGGDFTADTDLPWEVPSALRFDDQAEFHPVKYLTGLAAAAREAGAEIFQRSRAVGVTDDDRAS